MMDSSFFWHRGRTFSIFVQHYNIDIMKTLIKNRNLWLISLALILLFSCKKYEPYVGEFELTVKVTDEITGKPVSDASVFVFERENGYIFNASMQIAEGLTDTNGIVKLKFYANENDYSYHFTITKIGRYETKIDNPEIILSKKGVSYQNGTLRPFGNITFNIKGNKGTPILNILNIQHTSVLYSGVDTSLTFFSELNYETQFIFNEYDGIPKGNSNIGSILRSDTLKIMPATPPDTAFYLIEF